MPKTRPHCPKCGKDEQVESLGEDTFYTLYECLNCLTIFSVMKELPVCPS